LERELLLWNAFVEEKQWNRWERKGKFNKFSWKLQLKGLRKISFEIKLMCVKVKEMIQVYNHGIKEIMQLKRKVNWTK
jgi:hypothetical protein